MVAMADHLAARWGHRGGGGQDLPTSINGFNNQLGMVTIAAKGNCDATVDAAGPLAIDAMQLTGSYQATSADISAWNGANVAKIEGDQGVTLFVHGALTGPVTADDGTVAITGSGTITSNVTGKWGVGVQTLGDYSGTLEFNRRRRGA